MTQARFDAVKLGDLVFYREFGVWARVTSTHKSAGRRTLNIGITYQGSFNPLDVRTVIISDRTAVGVTEASKS